MPKGTLIRAIAFTAHPFASRMGPRLRLRSLSHAMSIEGPEIASKSARIPSGMKMPRVPTFLMTPDRKATHVV